MRTKRKACVLGETRDRRTKLCRPKMKPGRKPGQKKTAKVKAISHHFNEKASQDLLRACKTIGEDGVIDLKSYLLDGANINVRDDSGKSCLMWLAQRGNVEMLELFLLNGANITLTTHARENALHFATESTLPILLQNKIPINQLSTENRTPLYNAILQQSVPITEMLLQHGAEFQPFDDTHINEVQYAMKLRVMEKNKKLLPLVLAYVPTEDLLLAVSYAQSMSESKVTPLQRNDYLFLSNTIMDMYHQRKKR